MRENTFYYIDIQNNKNSRLIKKNKSEPVECLCEYEGQYSIGRLQFSLFNPRILIFLT